MQSESTFGPWLTELKSEDDRAFRDAAKKIWDELGHQIKALAGRKLGGFPQRAFGESDVANSGFNSFCQGARAGRFETLDSKADLWKVLGCIIARKAKDYVRAASTQKRGRGLILDDANETLAGPPTDPADEMILDELLAQLDRRDSALRTIALRLLAGYENAEIAEEMTISVRTVERKRELLREIWASQSMGP